MGDLNGCLYWCLNVEMFVDYCVFGLVLKVLEIIYLLLYCCCVLMWGWVFGGWNVMVIVVMG